MNKKFNNIYDFAEHLTLHHMPPMQIRLELSKMSSLQKREISKLMWSFMEKIDSNQYSPDQGFVVLATYAAAVADDFNTSANIVLITMFENHNE